VCTSFCWVCFLFISLIFIYRAPCFVWGNNKRDHISTLCNCCYIYLVRAQMCVITVLQNACLLPNVSNNSVICLLTVRNHSVLSNYSLDYVPAKMSDLYTSNKYHGDRGGTVVKALCYNSEGRWFDPRWCH